MNEQMTAEQVAAALNEMNGGKGWRGRRDWADCGGVHVTMWIGSPLLPMADWLDIEDARAIVAGDVAKRELAELQLKYDQTGEHFAREALRNDEIERELIKAQEELAALKAEHKRVVDLYEAGCTTWNPVYEELQNRVTALTEETTQLKGRVDHLYQDALIGHRWFEKRFGEDFNGRDFAVKCPMADERLKAEQAAPMGVHLAGAAPGSWQPIEMIEQQRLCVVASEDGWYAFKAYDIWHERVSGTDKNCLRLIGEDGQMFLPAETLEAALRQLAPPEEGKRWTVNGEPLKRLPRGC